MFGVLGFFAFYAFTYYALKRLPGRDRLDDRASVPLLTFLLAVLQRLERFRWRGLMGAVVAVTGVAIMAGRVRAGDLHLPRHPGDGRRRGVRIGGGPDAEAVPREPPVTTNAVGVRVGGMLLIGLSPVIGETLALPPGPSRGPR